MTEIIANPQSEDDAGSSAVRVDNAGYASDGAGPFTFQYRVLKAVVLREMSQRHGQYRVGYLLSLMMPILGIASIVVMFGFRGKVIPSDFPLGVFVVTGYPLWQGFQGMYTKVVGTASRNDPLLMFPQITQLDLIFSTIILEWATNTVILPSCASA